MKIAELVANDPTGIAQKYLASSQQIYDYLGVAILAFDLDVVANKISFDFFADQKFQAHPGIVHGGIVSAISDTAMGILAMGLTIPSGSVVFTAQMNTRYIKPMQTGVSYRITAELVSRNGNQLTTKVVLENGLIGIVAESEALFIQKTYEH